MSRSVTYDDLGNLVIRFPYDRDLVDLVKTLPSRRWNAAERHWSVPDSEVLAAVEVLHPVGFSFDEQIGERYRLAGGTLSLSTSNAQVEPETSTDYTVSQLNEKVKQVLEGAFPASIWLIGEISGFNKSAHRRHVTFQLVEHDENGTTLSTVAATLFDRDRTTIERALSSAGDPFRLEDEIKVRLRARVELYVPWGSYRVIVDGLDVNFTLGEAARRREEIIRRLTKDGLVGINPAIPIPAMPLRVGVITSLGSDAYNDVRRSFEESGFAFRLTIHGARVQGSSTEPSVLNALDWFAERHDQFDVLLICRGGGSRTDLAWFDSAPLGIAVARMPLPVVVGIGHEQDLSVLDAVARSAKTPTAAAALLINTVSASTEQLEEHCRLVLQSASAMIAEERSRAAERGRRLALGAGNLLALARHRLAGLSSVIPKTTLMQLSRQTLVLENMSRSLVNSIPRLLQLERERTAARQQRLRLVDPRRVLDRGYAILRLDDGRVLTDAAAAEAGTSLRAELRQGELQLRSEGPGQHTEVRQDDGKENG
jgi:exodeoxyribonuclease VII large subunit